jgi:hypothetical protein
MRRREAIQLFREIGKCIPDAFISSISLSSITPSKTDFELRLNVALDEKCLANVETLVSKRGLTLKEGNDSLLIYGSSPKKNLMRVPA